MTKNITRRKNSTQSPTSYISIVAIYYPNPCIILLYSCKNNGLVKIFVSD